MKSGNVHRHITCSYRVPFLLGLCTKPFQALQLTGIWQVIVLACTCKLCHFSVYYFIAIHNVLHASKLPARVFSATWSVQGEKEHQVPNHNRKTREEDLDIAVLLRTHDTRCSFRIHDCNKKCRTILNATAGTLCL